MAYTPSNSFSSGTVIKASDLEENLVGLLKYIDGGVIFSDFKVGAWVDTVYIMKGEYFPLTKTHEFVTGLVSGQPKTPKNVTSHIFHMNTDATNNDAKELPGTGVTFWPISSGQAYMAWEMYPYSLQRARKEDQNLNERIVMWAAIGGSLQTSTKFWTCCEAQFGDGEATATVSDARLAPSWEMRQCYSGFQIWSHTPDAENHVTFLAGARQSVDETSSPTGEAVDHNDIAPVINFNYYLDAIYT